MKGWGLSARAVGLFLLLLLVPCTESRARIPAVGPSAPEPGRSLVVVGTVSDSSSEAYLRERRIVHKGYRLPIDAIGAMNRGEIEAVVYDVPLLRYLVKEPFPGKVEVLPLVFERQSYGIALPPGSPLREPINQALLQTIRQPEWDEVLFEYLGTIE